MGSINPQSWLEYIAQQTHIPIDQVKKRVTVEYWKDSVGFHDLGIFVSFLEAIDVQELKITSTNIVCNVRTQSPVTPVGTNVRLSIPKMYYDIILHMEYGDKFKFVDSTGSPHEISQLAQEKYPERRENYLKISRITE